jgi:ribosomal protein S8
MMKNITQAINEVLYQASYLADEGYGSTEVTGGQYTVTLTGDKKDGDPVSD